MRQSFRFSPTITIVAMILSTIMLVASYWQWTRYKYKIGLLESLRVNSISTPILFPPVANESRSLENSKQLQEKKIEVQGIYDYEHQVIVTNREGQIGRGVGPGHLLLTPLLLNEGRGPAVLVSRGFIPFEDREPAKWGKYSFTKPGEISKIQAVLAPAISPSRFAPQNPKGSGPEGTTFIKIWFYEEISAMAKQLPYPVLENIYLQLLGGPPQGEFPREAVKIQVPPTTHFGYTIEWFFLAIATWALAFFFQCYSWKGNRLPPPISTALHSFVLAFFLGLLFSSDAHAIEDPGKMETEIGIIQHLGAQVDLNLPFQDNQGKIRPLREFLKPGRPSIIVPVYFGCPRLCTLTFEGLTKYLNQSKLSLEKDFNLLVFSINPDETPEMAVEKAKSVYSKLKIPNLSAEVFPFVVGKQESIVPLTNQLGFIYERDGMDYAHSPGIMLLTPDGKISRYFLGVDYPESELRYSLVEASNGQIGGLAEQIFLYCFRFDPTKGKYTPAAWRLMRVVCGLAAVLLAGFLAVLWRKEFEKKTLRTDPPENLTLQDEDAHTGDSLPGEMLSQQKVERRGNDR